MNNENFHPILNEPPLAHALHKWNEETRELTYEYNGRNIMTIEIPGDEEIGFRHGSDGNIQNNPFVQQLYFMVDQPIHCRCTFLLSDDAVCMRPKRAGHEEAILGQVGKPLMEGVNGLYDINQDLLIEWLGRSWHWEDTKLLVNDNNELYAVVDVELGPSPWVINLRMQYYRQHLGYEYHKPWEFRPNMKPVSGWCSWEASRRDVCQNDIKEASDFFDKHLKDYGFEYIQLDDGFENMPLPYKDDAPLSEGWLHTNGQFPQGHEGVVDKVKSTGLSAGIWTNANVTNKAFAKNYEDHFLKGADGELMLGEWIDYLITCSPESLEIHVLPFYKGLKEMGYDYFKTDAIRHLLFDGLHEAVRQGLMSNDDARDKFRAYMQAARDGIGEDAYLLASWGVMAEVIGLVDACRIAMDANPTWAGIRMQLFESARWFHTQRILFLNDPDHICGRAKLEWTRTVTSLVSLTGSLLMLSDPLADYDEDRLELFKRNLPTLNTMTGETGALDMDYAAFTWTKLHGFAVPREEPVKAEDVSLDDAWNMSGESPTMKDNHPFSTLWAIHMDHNDREWCVGLRVATVPLEGTIVGLDQFNLRKDKAYHVVDFWARDYMGISSDKISCKALDLGECQVIGLVPVKDVPHVVTSFRHVSMGAISISKEYFEDDKLVIELEGIVGQEETLWVSIPEGYEVDKMTTYDGSIVSKKANELYEYSVSFDKKKMTLVIGFK
ncbi:MAG: alpha-galactosidase [Spirochaetaceae bacterium]